MGAPVSWQRDAGAGSYINAVKSTGKKLTIVYPGDVTLGATACTYLYRPVLFSVHDAVRLEPTERNVGAAVCWVAF